MFYYNVQHLIQIIHRGLRCKRRRHTRVDTIRRCRRYTVDSLTIRAIRQLRYHGGAERRCGKTRTYVRRFSTGTYVATIEFSECSTEVRHRGARTPNDRIERIPSRLERPVAHIEGNYKQLQVYLFGYRVKQKARKIRLPEVRT